MATSRCKCEDSEYDPDEGLELREDFALKLEASIRALEAGEPTIPAEEVYRRLGMSE